MVLRWVLLVALLCGAVAQAGGAEPSRICGTGPVIDVARVQRQLSAAQQLWQRRGPEEYGLTTEVKGQIGFTTTLQVGRGVVSGLSTVDSPLIDGQVKLSTHDEAPAFARRYTVPGLFAQVQALLDVPPKLRPPLISRGAPALPALVNSRCGALKVKFDPVDGHLRLLAYNSAYKWLAGIE